MALPQNRRRWPLLEQIALLRSATVTLYIPYVLVAVGAFILISLAFLSLWNLPYFGLGNYDAPLRAPWHGSVDRLYTDSPVGRAGLRKGDVVLSVGRPDGTDPTTVLYHTLSEGASTNLDITVQRGGEKLKFVLQPEQAPANIAVARYEPLVIALALWFIGLIVWSLQPFNGAARLFFLVCQLAAAILGTGAITSIYLWLPASAYMFRVLLVALAPVTFHFYATFPNPLPQPRLRWLLRVAYGSAFTVLVLTVALPVFLSVDIADLAPQTFQRAYVALMLIATLVVLLRRQTYLPIQTLYRRRLLIAGMIGSILPLIAISLAPEVLTGNPMLEYVWTFPALILLPLSVALAVRQGEMGKVDTAINRSLVYVLLATLLVGVYALLFWALDRFDPQIWSRPLFAGMLAVVAILLYNPARLFLQRLVDRIFYGGWYDYRKVVRDKGAELNKSANPGQLAARLMDIAATMRFESAAMMAIQGDELAALPEGNFGYDRERLSLWHAALKGPFVCLLTKSPQPWERKKLLAEIQQLNLVPDLTAGEYALLHDDNVQFCLPLVNHNEIQGILLLGKRYGETTLNDDDLHILVPISGQAALAAENASLLETLLARLAEMSSMRDDLARAHGRLVESREEERLRLAHELHDGAVQQLLGISYQLVQNISMPTGTPPQTKSDAHAHTPALPMTPEAIRQEMLGVVSQLRDLISELRPAGLEEFGLVTALKGYVDRVEREGGWETPEFRLELPPDEVELPRPAALVLFRVAQEAIRNALKHSEATEISLRLWIAAEDNEVTLVVEDNGRGFDSSFNYSDMIKQRHFGLIGMFERAEWARGKLAVETERGKGTKVTTRIPLSQGAGNSNG